MTERIYWPDTRSAATREADEAVLDLASSETLQTLIDTPAHTGAQRNDRAYALRLLARTENADV